MAYGFEINRMTAAFAQDDTAVRGEMPQEGTPLHASLTEMGSSMADLG